MVCVTEVECFKVFRTEADFASDCSTVVQGYALDLAPGVNLG